MRGSLAAYYPHSY